MSHSESSSCRAIAANGWKAVGVSLDYLPKANVTALPDISLRHVSLQQKISVATSTSSHFGSFLWPISGSSVKGYV
ncbi:hypothetical protein CGCTS75_v002463 [Colletotrichum tropicale]|nr:hypothetical protein CGCTS75_v002463 [Colletotrichum tropicale]